MVKLFIGSASLEDHGFMDFDDHVMRCFCVAADDKAFASTKICKAFKQAYGLDPELVCLREILEVDGYRVILEPKLEKG